jgi:hypothetical protein
MTILTAVPENPFGYGRVVRSGHGSAAVEAIVEQKSLAPDAGGLSARSTPESMPSVPVRFSRIWMS